MNNDSLQLPSGEPKELSAAIVFVPYRRDDPRAKYIGYLACGFSDEESLYVLGLNRAWLEANRQDEKFAQLEEHIPDLKKELSHDYTQMDFIRNFRMVLEKDHRVLRTALGMNLVIDEETGDEVAAELTPQDHQYLLKLRSAYTPQQMQLLEAVVAGKDGGWNFADWVSKNEEVIALSRTDTITLARRAESSETLQTT